jgi:subtilisin family serine protease
MTFRGLLASLIFAPALWAQSTASFRLPVAMTFERMSRASAPAPLVRSVAPQATTLWASPVGASEEIWEFTDRLVLHLEPGVRLTSILAGRPLLVAREVASGLVILQAPNAETAWAEADALASLPGVRAAYPVPHAPKAGLDAYAAAPNDELFPVRLAIPGCEIAPGVIIPGQTVTGQWYLENRDPARGTELGVDLNVRPAWAQSRGEGITVAVADSGIELTHPDLMGAIEGAPHFNFSTGVSDGSPVRRTSTGAHGTSVAGLIGATAGNTMGMSGVAPAARLAGWVIYDANGRSVTTERIGDMFRYASNIVSVQNHSWGPVGLRQRGPDALEDAGLEDAWTRGRDGLGTVMVFAAGNDRATGGWANDNGFASDPRGIGVAGVDSKGRATAASEPGSSILVAAPTGSDAEGGLFTTDLLGTDGANFVSFCLPYEHLSGYRWADLGFKHTSAAAPLVSGTAALMLSANPTLSARDVQQVLLLSARQIDRADPDLKTNAAGLMVSHNVGFGVVNAAEAVRLAVRWSNRPAAQQLIQTLSTNVPVPDGGLGVEVRGTGVTPEIAFISGISGFGIQPDAPMAFVPLVDIGRATSIPSARLDGRGALIERGDILYDAKLENAAAAGAAFAVVYNLETSSTGSCPGGNQLCVPVATDYSPIPVVFIGRTAGLTLREQILADPDTTVRIALVGPRMEFHVPQTWQCERVGVRLKTDFTVRGDLRITLTSPKGTPSILQRYNGDTAAGPSDWTYWSTHHYFEPSAGPWTLAVTDEAPGEGTGNLLEASLIVNGVPIADGDGDGLDDAWEQVALGTLEWGPADDPDGDGYSNLRESLEGSNPLVDERPEMPDVAFFNDDHVRVSWPGQLGDGYRLWSWDRLGANGSAVIVPGRFPVTAEVIPAPGSAQGFFRVENVSR